MSLELLGAIEIKGAIGHGHGGGGHHGGGGRGMRGGFWGWGGPWYDGYVVDEPFDTPSQAEIDTLADQVIKERAEEKNALVESVAEKLVKRGIVPTKVHGRSLLGAVEEEYGPLSPEQLANLDRALSPAEQKAVDDYQGGQASAMQAKEEAKPFIDPNTGKLTRVKTTYTTEPVLAKVKKPTIVTTAVQKLVAWQTFAIIAGAAVGGGLLGAIIVRSFLGAFVGFALGGATGAGIEFARGNLELNR